MDLEAVWDLFWLILSMFHWMDTYGDNPPVPFARPWRDR